MIQTEIKLDSIPLALRELPQWVVWKMASRSESEAPTKLPFQVDGKLAKANDPSTWTSFEIAVAHYSKGGYSGIGFEFSETDEFCGIDLDGARNPETGKVADWAREIILDLDSYAEVSPSGTGIKIFIIAKSPFDSGRKKELDQERVSDKTPAIEVYDKLRYFAMTGWKLRGPGDAMARQAKLEAICKRFWTEPTFTPANRVNGFYDDSSVIERARKYIAKLPGAVSGQGGHNAAFHVACVLILGFGLNKNAAIELFREYNQLCQPPWSDREVLHKIDSASKQAGERNYLRNVIPENWAAVKVPKYVAPRPKSEPRVSTLADAADKCIARYESGTAVMIETGIGDLDYAMEGGVEPGEMVLLCARPSHGKSAVALQMVHYWTETERPCLIISEEMSALALGKRTLQYISDVPRDQWRSSTGELKASMAYYREKHKPAILAESCGTIEAAVEQIDHAVEKHKIQMVIVDYAQLLRSPGKSRYEQVTHTSTELRAAASRHNIVLVALCQLNRDIENRKGPFIPVLADIKDSGQLEQDADVVIFMVWPWKLDQHKPKEEYQFFVAKNRNRETVRHLVQCRFVAGRQMVIPDRKPLREADDFGEYGGTTDGF